jgi:hypothetical protein
MKPVDKFEMNRMAHARAQELNLPGSPAGRNGHRLLSHAALAHFGRPSWSHLTVNEMRAIYEFMDTHHRMPARGELPK